MNKKELVSIIIPVYNVEKYVEKCIQSLCKQTYNNIEILLVDDGSTDSSGEICEFYANKDSRIKVFHKENGGQGSARNLALDNAKGNYICFLDSDDSVKEDYVEFLYNLLIERNLDISICNYEIYDENNRFLKKRNTGEGYVEFSNIEAINSMWYSELINIGPWGKLYKKELWDKNRFEECFSEDFATMHRIYILANKIGYSYECKLMYLIRSNSAIHMFCKKKLKMLDIANNNIEFAERYPELKKAAYNKAISVNFHVLFQLPDDEGYEEVKMKIKKFIKENRNKVLFDSRSQKKVKIAAILSFLGFNNIKKIFSIIKKHNSAF